MAETTGMLPEGLTVPGDLTVGEVLVQSTLSHRVIRFTYHDLRRIVEPHLVGLHEAGDAMLLGYQTGGFSRSGEVPGWRTFIIIEIHGVELDEERFSGPRGGFVRSGERMIEIFARA
jgi:hypothetical protein